MANSSPHHQKPHSNSNQHNALHLAKEITLLRQEIQKSNSFLQKFFAGLLTGLGTVLGATVLLALLIYLLSQLATFEWLKPFVEQIVEIVKNSTK